MRKSKVVLSEQDVSFICRCAGALDAANRVDLGDRLMCLIAERRVSEEKTPVSAATPVQDLTVRQLQIKAWTTAEAKGWHVCKVTPNYLAAKLALVHSELSEALECLRDHSHTEIWEGCGGKPEGFAVELADAMIRIADLAGIAGVDLSKAIERKLKHNETREYRHGDRKL